MFCTFLSPPSSLLWAVVAGVKLLFVLLPAWRHPIWLWRIENGNSENECFASLPSLTKPFCPRSACNNGPFQNAHVRLFQLQTKPHFWFFNQPSAENSFDVLKFHIISSWKQSVLHDGRGLECWLFQLLLLSLIRLRTTSILYSFVLETQIQRV